MSSLINKGLCLSAAIEITKEYARGSNGQIVPQHILKFLQDSYKALVELMEESAKS